MMLRRVGHRASLSRSAAALAAVAAALAVASCGSTPEGSRGGSSTTTAPPTTTVPAVCPRFGATTPVSGAAAVTRTPRIALVRNVQVQASDCTDVMSFLFWGGTPGWSVSYRSGPLVLDPSGQRVVLAGAAHLVVRFEPASGVDLSRPEAATIYDGPTDMTPSAPSGIRQLRRLGDFEGVTTWAVGLDQQRPFTVETAKDHLVIRFSAPSPRVSRCELHGAGVSLGYPVGWFSELSPRWSCGFFGPHPFTVVPASDAVNWAVTVERADIPADQVVAQIMSSDAHVVRSSATVAGYPATVLDITESGKGLLPSGYVHRMYVVATGARALVLDGTPAPAKSAVAQFNRSAVDRMAELVERA